MWVEGTIPTHVISLEDRRLYSLSHLTSLCFLNRESYSSLGWPEICYVAQSDACLCIHMSAHGSQKRALDSLELELQLRATLWVLGTKHETSARVVTGAF